MIRGISGATRPEIDVGPIRRFYRHGWQSWSPSGWVDPEAPAVPIPDEARRLSHDDPKHAFDRRVGSSDVGVAIDPDGRATLLGALAPGARVWPDGSKLRGSSESAIGWITAQGPPNELFDVYAKSLRESLGTRPRRPQRVWCSWYSFYEQVTQADVAEILVSSMPYDFDVIQVDDGWQVGVGDWSANDDFPAGMESTAEAIRATGRIAGLWLAPYIAQSTSRLVAERPELLLRDADGAPVVSGINWGGPYYSLDPTSEATTQFVTQLITRVRSWGFDYLKLDFLYGAAFPGRHERSMLGELAYRQGALAIREAAGDDCYLLACGAPILSSIGIFDAIRIGPDVAEFWEDPALSALGDRSGRGARNAIATTSNRLWLRHVITVDPDVVFFDRSAVQLDEHTLESLCDLARIAGFVGTSDRLGDLTSQEGLELIEMLSHEPDIRRQSGFGWLIDERPVDFGWIQSEPTPSHST